MASTLNYGNCRYHCHLHNVFTGVTQEVVYLYSKKRIMMIRLFQNNFMLFWNTKSLGCSSPFECRRTCNSEHEFVPAHINSAALFWNKMLDSPRQLFIPTLKNMPTRITYPRMIDFCFENMITGISDFLIANALVRWTFSRNEIKCVFGYFDSINMYFIFGVT